MMSASPSAFDELAVAYDREELNNPIRQLMRERSLAALHKTFPSPASLLDVGCGTGTEAIWLAGRGHHVTAIDSSPKMLEVLEQRAAAAGLKIPTRLISAGEMSRLVADLGERAFDGAYSSFGALNTEPSLEPPLAAIAGLVRPQGRIVISVMNRWCIAEIAMMSSRLRFRDAFRRLRRSLPVAVGSAITEVSYPSWLQLGHALSRNFDVLQVEALTLLLPPYAMGLAAHARTYRIVERLDTLLMRRRPFNWLGDHILVIAERR